MPATGFFEVPAQSIHRGEHATSWHEHGNLGILAFLFAPAPDVIRMRVVRKNCLERCHCPQIPHPLARNRLRLQMGSHCAHRSLTSRSGRFCFLLGLCSPMIGWFATLAWAGTRPLLPWPLRLWALALACWKRQPERN